MFNIFKRWRVQYFKGGFLTETDDLSYALAYKLLYEMPDAWCIVNGKQKIYKYKRE